MTQTPREVIEETISQADTLFVAQAAGGYGLVVSPRDLKQIIADLKEAEAREQRLKEAITEALSWTWGYFEGNMLEVRAALSGILSTLYPDTPAPTNEEV